MYKETTICICIIILIIWLDILTQNYTKTSTIEITECLSELKKEIEDKSLENAKEKLGELDKKWDEKHDKLAYYIEHDELEKVDTAIVQVKSFVENEEIPSAIAELETEKVQIEELLCSGTLSVDELTEKSKRLPEVNDLIDEKTMRWLELSEIEASFEPYYH